MNEFVGKHEDRIHGVLSCFDRMLFRGYLLIMSGWSMAQLLLVHGSDSADVKPFLLSNAERVKSHAQALARKPGRPFEYLSAKLRKEDAARKVVERDGKQRAQRVRLRKGVAYLFRYRAVSLQANARYLDALAALVC